MTAYTWIGETGDWDLASNWSPSSPAGPPKATDTATISATGPAYTVMIDTADVAKSLTESSASATIDDTGSLTLSRTFTLSAGTFILGPGGTLSGGTTKLRGGTFVCDGGTLSGVTYDGTLGLSGSGASVHLASGTVVNNAAGTGAGTINDTGKHSTLYFDNTQTFNNATINLGSRSGGRLIERDTTGAGTVLTLGSGVTIDESGFARINTGNYAGDGIVDEGNITVSGDSDLTILGNSFASSGTITAKWGGQLEITTTTFTNDGAIDIGAGGYVAIRSTNFTNAANGVITVGADSELELDLTPGGSWSYLGSITFASGSILVLGGSFTLAGLGTLTNSGAPVYIEGTLDNTDGTLNGSNVLGQLVLSYGGTVQGGTVTPSGLVLEGGTLSGVTYDGTLDLSGGFLHLADGTVVNDAAGTGAGTINDIGTSTLFFDNTQTFNNATIDLGSTSGVNYSRLYENDSTGAGTVLTLGSNVTIDESGYAQIYTGGAAGDGIVNQGNINQTATGSTLAITGNSFTNSGTITAASSGGTLTIDTTTFTNLSSNTLTGGTYEAQAGSTLVIDGDHTITTDDADIILSGDGTIETRSTSSGSTIDTTLLTIGASGELQLLASRNWTTANAAITNDGMIQLGGGTLTSTGSSASLTDAAGSTLRGFGTVTATAFANSGTIEASGGTLTLTDAVTGKGTDTISGTSTLQFDARVSSAKTLGDQDIVFTGGGTLDLLKPTSFYGEVSGFAAGDTVELLGSWAFSGFSENSGGTLATLTLVNGTTTHAFDFVGDYAPGDFKITSGATSTITHT